MEPEPKRKVGRPLKPKNERRNPGVSFRLTNDESTALEIAAKASGIGKSDFAKKCLILALKKGIRIT